IQECSLTALETMEKMSLGKRVQAALLKENFIFTQFHLEVPEKGVVQLTGFTNAEEDKQRMVQIAKGVEGVSDVQDEVSILRGGRY
ncbi:MAG: BON domain-containing protein, partial [Proteobacteria bacterium]|nr:BON domain-containing protein [Pseudomonadota bacterium]